MRTTLATSHFDAVWQHKQKIDLVAIQYRRGQNERVDEALEALPSGERLLDIGCGTGLLAAEAGSRFKSVFGIDIASDPVATAASLGVQSVVGDFAQFNLPFADHSFDAVTTLASIQYAHEPLSFLQECQRVLKPNGVLLLSVPNMRTVGKIFRLVIRGEFPKVSGDPVGYDGGTLRYFCYRDIAGLLADAGFTIDRRHGIYCRPRTLRLLPEKGPLAWLKHEFFSGEIFLSCRKVT